MIILNTLVLTPAFAAEPSPSTILSEKASSGSAVPCLPLHKSGMATNAPLKVGAAPTRTQRTAGSPSLSPAMALALALGVRNVAGPMKHSARHIAVKAPPPVRQAARSQRDQVCVSELSANFTQSPR